MTQYNRIDTAADAVVLTTPSDSVVFPQLARGFIVAVAGNVAVTDSVGNVTTIPACIAGVEYRVHFSKLMATNTAATGIVVLF